MVNFLKGIVVGIGGISPGLSGSILLVVFGLYKKTIEAIGTLFKDFKKNLIFLVPLFLGFCTGIFIFSKLVDFLITKYEMYTRYTFLGLIIGTIPLFYKEVKKKGFNRKYYFLIGLSFILGLILFFFNNNLFPTVTIPNLTQSFVLGIAVAGSTIVPGVDSAAILSAFGLYEIYVSSIANIDFGVLIAAAFGLILGALAISFILNKLIDKYYTVTFSIIFGLFLSIIPSILNESCYLSFNLNSIISIVLFIVGFGISRFLDKLKENSEIIKQFFTTLRKISAKIT